jgi:hypothetical protein
VTVSHRLKPAAGVVLVVLALLVGSRCGRNDLPSEAARFREAIETTSEFESLHAELRVRVDGRGADVRSSFDYQAPDRLRTIEGSELGTLETLLIGSRTFVELPDRRGFFREGGAATAHNDPQSVFAGLKEAIDVTHDGSGFTFRLRPGPLVPAIADGKVVVRGMHLVGLTLGYEFEHEDIELSYTFSRFGDADAVNPPPLDRVVEGESGTVGACRDDGTPPEGEIVCVGT